MHDPDHVPEPVKPRKRVDFLVDKAWRRGKCRGCSAPIVWRTYADKKGIARYMPLDPATAVDTAEGTRMESHHAHCPEAGRFRQKGRR